MIFVIIGVVILVVSFIIALQSLIREQQKAQRLPIDDEEPPAQTRDETRGEKKRSVLSPEAQELLKKSPVRPDDVLLQSYQPQAQTQSDTDGAQDSVSQDLKGEGREPFPWEKDFDDDSIKKTEGEGEKIERLKSQLEQIKAAKSAASRDPDTVDYEKPQVGATDYQGELRGEISIRDLKKKSF